VDASATTPLEGASATEIATIGLDLTKNAFQVHGSTNAVRQAFAYSRSLLSR
jgi:hypothetical protein